MEKARKNSDPLTFYTSIYNFEKRFDRFVGGIPPSLIFIAGLVFSVALVILPEVLAAIRTPEGFVWSPIHSQNYRLGDLYYYGSWLKEVLDTGLPAYSPSAGELAGQPLIETWRSVGLAIAAVPGILIKDIRYLIVFDYGLSAALFFTSGYFFALALSRNHWIACLTGISVLFLTDRLWVPAGPYSATILGVWQVPASFFSLIIHYFRDIRTVADYDIFGSTFRFINMSFSAPVLLFYYLFATLAYIKSSMKMFFVLFIMSPVMAFTYPSHTVIAYALLFMYAVLSLARRNFRTGILFTSVGAATLIFLEIIRYRQLFRRLLETSQLWNNIFASEKMVLISGDVGTLFSIILTGKYLLSFLILYFLTRTKPALRDVVIVTGIIAIFLSGIYLFTMPQLSTRFLGRGIDYLWFMLMIVVALVTLYDKIQASDITANAMHARVIYRWMYKSAALVVFVAIVSFSGYAFGSIALKTSTNNSRYISQETMKTYTWIDQNLPPKSEVASLDWEDITLLPVFTKANLVVGHSVIDGRSLDDELDRYLATWKFVGLGRREFEETLDRGPMAMKSLCAGSAYKRVPVLSNDDFNAAQFMNGVLYWPHIKQMNNILIVRDQGITPEFKNWMLEIYDRTSSADYTKKFRAKYLLLNNEQARVFGGGDKHKLLYKSANRVIYALPD